MAILQTANINVNSTGDNLVVAAVTGMQIRVHKLVLINTVATAMTVTIKDAAGGNSLATIPLPSSIGGAVNLGRGNVSDSPLFRTATSGAFNVSLSTNTAVTGFVQYEVA